MRFFLDQKRRRAVGVFSGAEKSATAIFLFAAETFFSQFFLGNQRD